MVICMVGFWGVGVVLGASLTFWIWHWGIVGLWLGITAGVLATGTSSCRLHCFRQCLWQWLVHCQPAWRLRAPSLLIQLLSAPYPSCEPTGKWRQQKPRSMLSLPGARSSKEKRQGTLPCRCIAWVLFKVWSHM